MAALNVIVMVVSGLWFLAYLDGHTRARKGRQSPSRKARSFDNSHQ